VCGDNLYDLAQRFGFDFSAIQKLNSHPANPNYIEPGWVLKAPRGRLQDPFVYDVQPGDTLSGIAFKYGLTLPSVLAANPNIENPDLIYPYDRITTPIYLPSQSYVDFEDINPPLAEMDKH
jgi:LysM repeat protein